MKKTKKILEIERRMGEDLGDYLRREYIKKGKDISYINNKLKVARGTVWRWLKKYNISIRSISEANLPKGFVKPTKEELEYWYYEEGKSMSKIATELGVVSTTFVMNLMGEHGIKRRTSAEHFLFKGFVKPTRKELKRLYHDEGKSTFQIARELGKISNSKVHKLMKKYEIPIMNSSEARLPKDFKRPTKNKLYQWYHKDGKSTIEIAEELGGVSSAFVRNLMNDYGINLIKSTDVKLPKDFKRPTKNKLYQWYHKDGKSTIEIAEELGISHVTISKWMKKYDIPIRTNTITNPQFLNLLKKDKTALSLSAAALSLNGRGYDVEKTILEVCEGRFKDEKQLHALLLENENEIYNLVQNGVTNLGKYLGQFTFGDRRIMPLLLGEALESIPEDKVTTPLEERFARILRSVYSPKFNKNQKRTMDELEKKIDNSKNTAKSIYQKLYNHYEEVLELEKELNR
jgi:transposase-like protein